MPVDRIAERQPAVAEQIEAPADDDVGCGGDEVASTRPAAAAAAPRSSPRPRARRRIGAGAASQQPCSAASGVAIAGARSASDDCAGAYVAAGASRSISFVASCCPRTRSRSGSFHEGAAEAVHACRTARPRTTLRSRRGLTAREGQRGSAATAMVSWARESSDRERARAIDVGPRSRGLRATCTSRPRRGRARARSCAPRGSRHTAISPSRQRDSIADRHEQPRSRPRAPSPGCRRLTSRRPADPRRHASRIDTGWLSTIDALTKMS